MENVNNLDLAGYIVQLEQKAEDTKRDRDNLEDYYKEKYAAATKILMENHRLIAKNNDLVAENKRLSRQVQKLDNVNGRLLKWKDNKYKRILKLVKGRVA